MKRLLTMMALLALTACAGKTAGDLCDEYVKYANTYETCMAYRSCTLNIHQIEEYGLITERRAYYCALPRKQEL
jgi:hypothetical protein